MLKLPKPGHNLPMSRRIEILAFHGCEVLDVTGPLQVFATANDLLLSSRGTEAYQVAVVGSVPQVRTASGLVLNVDELSRSGCALDTLLVSGGKGVASACADEALLGWVSSSAARAARVASVCSGAFLLASAGLLNGRKAVTHWSRCTEFGRLFPEVTVVPDAIYVRDGNIWTSAGVTAGIDLALALVELDFDRALALSVARQLVVFLKRPGGQAQFSAALASQGSDSPFDLLNAWILNHLEGDLSVKALAERTNMSERSFARHYLAASGRTPGRAVESLRVEAAQRWLEQDKNLSKVARRCGFGSERSMRRSFQRLLGVTASDYSERFGG